METTEYIELVCSRDPWVRTETLQLGDVVPRKLMLMAARCCLMDPHWAVRDAAAELIGRVGSNRDGFRLLAASWDPSWDVRYTVLMSFASLKINRSTKRVREMLVADPHPVVRREAAWALYYVDREPGPALTSALQNEEVEMVRVAIFGVLYLVGENSALDEMLSYVQSSDFQVRGIIVNSLRKMDIRVEQLEKVKRFLATFILNEVQPGVKADAEAALLELST
jgi:hypothetical protein